MLEKNFIKLEVAETLHNRDYWAARPWVTEEKIVRENDAFLLPWHELSDGDDPMYPQGTTDYVRMLREQGFPDIALVVGKEAYAELAMYGRSWRLPALFVTLVALPAFANLLGGRIDKMLPGVKSNDEVQMEIIVERPNCPCIKFTYKGPAERLPETMLREIDNCFEEASNKK